MSLHGRNNTIIIAYVYDQFEVAHSQVVVSNLELAENCKHQWFNEQSCSTKAAWTTGAYEDYTPSGQDDIDFSNYFDCKLAVDFQTEANTSKHHE